MIAASGSVARSSGDPKQAGVMLRYCPRCEVQHFQQYEVVPDHNPRFHRRRCHNCGWNSGWVAWGSWIVRQGP